MSPAGEPAGVEITDREMELLGNGCLYADRPATLAPLIDEAGTDLLMARAWREIHRQRDLIETLAADRARLEAENVRLKDELGPANSEAAHQEFRLENDRVWRTKLDHLKAALSESAAREAELREALERTAPRVLRLAEQRCPCNDDSPSPCPLCGARVDGYGDEGVCKADKYTLPRDLIDDLRRARSLLSAVTG